MPEIIEIEMYRRGADALIGRSITSLDAPDDWYLKGIDADALRAALTGATIEGTDRIGKLMLMHTSAGTVGLRFGMTGRLVVDEVPIIESLEYSAKRLAPEWDRFRFDFAPHGSLRMNDPRRLGGVSLEPDLSGLGPDVWSMTADDFGEVISKTKVALKALLLNQKRLAGLGNLLADEVCWRAGINPTRTCDELSAQEITTLGEYLQPMLDELLDRGGSHRGDHFEARDHGSQCPRDGGRMLNATIGGRSTWWCDTHQQ